MTQRHIIRYPERQQCNQWVASADIVFKLMFRKETLEEFCVLNCRSRKYLSTKINKHPIT